MISDTMRPRVPSAGFRVCLATLAILLATTAFAQLPTTVTISDPRGEIAQVLTSGQQLEQQRRWGEALAIYEDAVRLHPQDASLQQRFDSTRFHYDLERRYADRSFRDSLSRLSMQQVLDLYSQVLLKIESHYVEVPRWKQLVDRGTNDLVVALSESTFVNENVPQRNRSAVEAFRQELPAMIGARAINNRVDARDAVTAAAQLAERQLEIPVTAAVFEYLCGATNALDPYSTYLTPGQLSEEYARIDGNFVGLGVDLMVQNGGLAIVRVFPGSPAEEAGVRAGDRILAVDGQSTGDYSTEQAANLLQGADGSLVALTLAAPGQQPRQVSVRRRFVEVPSVDRVGIIDAQYGIGYFKLSGFSKTTARELDAALSKLDREGMKSLVIDVRGNPGGLLVAAVEVVDRFVDRGVIVSTRGRTSEEDLTYSAREQEQRKWRTPLVVLIDQDSASAAEIFAGAIRDHHRGTLVGVRSFGKGSVQGIFNLDQSSAGVKLTISKFYSPNGRPYSQVGVEPDLTVQVAARPVNGQLPVGEDAMLTTAMQAARSLSANLQARNSP